MTERHVEPIVQAPSRRRHSRIGKGFSIKELQDAGLTVAKAKKLDIAIDMRRRTSYDKNVQMLKMEYTIDFPLTEITGVGKAAEKKLIHAGIFDARDIAEMSLDELSARVKYSRSKLKKWQAEAKKMTKRKHSQ